MSSDEKVIMHQELSEENLDNVTGGRSRFDEIDVSRDVFIVGAGYDEFEPVVDLKSIVDGKPIAIDWCPYK